MVRNYVKKTITRYSERDLLNAVEEYKCKSLSMISIVKKYNVPATTIRNNLDKIRKKGRNTFFINLNNFDLNLVFLKSESGALCNKKCFTWQQFKSFLNVLIMRSKYFKKC